MVDRVQMAQGETGPVAPQEQAPDQFAMPDKFKEKSAEDIAKAYVELEKKLGNTNQQNTETNNQANEQNSNTNGVPQDAYTSLDNISKEISERGLDYNKFVTEYNDKGGLSEESYAELEAAGFTKQGVNDLIERESALSNQKTEELLKPIGGREAFQKISDWATKNVAADELKDINDILADGNASAIRLTLEALKFRMERSTGNEPNLLGGEHLTGGGVSPFQSWAQVQAEMAKPEYSKDPAFRKQIEQRLQISKI